MLPSLVVYKERALPCTVITTKGASTARRASKKATTALPLPNNGPRLRVSRRAPPGRCHRGTVRGSDACRRRWGQVHGVRRRAWGGGWRARSRSRLRLIPGLAVGGALQQQLIRLAAHNAVLVMIYLANKKIICLVWFSGITNSIYAAPGWYINMCIKCVRQTHGMCLPS